MSLKKPKTMPIAIVGMAGRYPGNVNSDDSLWNICMAAQNTWSAWPTNRLNEDTFQHPRPEHLGTTHSRGGHFLNDDIAAFDTSFFNLTADMAKAMDPQIRLLLETTFEAFETAGLPLEKVAGSATSVFAGAMFHDYQDMLLQDPDNLPRYFLTGNGPSMVANRISHFFDLRGPSISVDTACSTTMAAIHLACQSIRVGDAEMAVVGGTNLLLYPSSLTGLSNLGLIGASGKSFSFDSQAMGYGRGEGVACIILKPLDNALQDGDPIRAVIRETGSNQDGHTPTITSPSQEAQESLIRACYERAGLDPKDTAYVESHGTGTIAGDTTEAQALGNMLCGVGRSVNDPLFVGSIKANFGHTESTSGLAAVMKVVLMLERGYIPQQALFSDPNPAIDFSKLNIKIPSENIPWPSHKRLRASVNNFGAGGTNTHIIIESAGYHYNAQHAKSGEMHLTYNSTLTSDIGTDQISINDTPLLFTICAKEETGVRLSIDQLATYLGASGQSESIENLAYTLTQRRSQFPWRVSLSVKSCNELREALEDKSLLPNQASLTRDVRLGFVFTGQGAQWYYMGRELVDVYPVFRNALIDADTQIKSLGASWGVLEELFRDEKSSNVNEPYLSFPLTVILQLALVRLLESWGIVPHAITAHSSGEIPAAYSARIISFEDAVTIAYIRGDITAQWILSGRLNNGGMTAIALGVEAATEYINQVTCGVAMVACINSSSSVTISGDIVALQQIEARCSAEKIFHRRLEVPAAYHSPHMQPLFEEYVTKLNTHMSCSVPSGPETAFSSPVTGGQLKNSDLLRESTHWAQNMTKCVQFEAAMKAMLLQSQSDVHRTEDHQSAVDIVIEVGPHGALQGFIQEILSQPEMKNQNVNTLTCLQRGENAIRTMQNLAGQLFCQGYSVNFQAINFPNGIGTPKVLISLPSYPWNHSSKYWVEPPQAAEAIRRKFAPHDLLGVRIVGLNQEQYIWRNILRISDVPWLQDHTLHSQILFPGAGWAVMAMEAMRQIGTSSQLSFTGYVLSDVELYNALIVPKTDEGVEVQLVIRDQSTYLLDSPECKEFSFLSRDKDGRWRGHCRRRISLASRRIETNFSTSEGSELTPVEISDFYNQMATSGPKMGPSFQKISRLARKLKFATAEIVVGDTASSMPFQYESHYGIHPTTLDACFQTAWCTVPEMALRKFGLCLPKFASRVYLNEDVHLSPGTQLSAIASLSAIDQQSFEVSVSLFDSLKPGANLIMKADGLRMVSLRQDDNPESTRSTTLLKTVWKPDIASLSVRDFLDQHSHTSVCEMDSVKSFGQECSLQQESCLINSCECTCFNKLKKYMEIFTHQYPHAQILEASSSAVDSNSTILKHLDVLLNESYDCKDISTSHSEEAYQKNPLRTENMHYEKLDFEDDQIKRDVNSDGYDLVIACNLLHSMANLKHSLQDLRKMLRARGRMLMIDTTMSKLNETLDIFDIPLWQSLLTETGFGDIDVLHEYTGINGHSHSVKLTSAVSNSHSQSSAYPEEVIIVELIRDCAVASSNLANRLGQELQSTTGANASVNSLENLVLKKEDCLVLLQTDARFLSSIDEESFILIQQALLNAGSVLWVSHSDDSDGNDPNAAIHVGLLRTLRLEEVGKRYVSLVINNTAGPEDSSVIPLVCDTFLRSMKSIDFEGKDNEFLAQSGRLAVPRLVSDLTMAIGLEKLQGNSVPSAYHFSLSGPYTRLGIESPGLLDSLTFSVDNSVQESITWNEDMVEINPHSFGLNFRDVLVAMGELEQNCLGYECAGLVTRVGSESKEWFQVGDRVCALLQEGHLANKVQTRRHGVMKIPEKMDFETAASIPMAFVTAYHALVELGNLMPEETVLIHSAAGGVGQAAITIAQYLGAELFVTVGNKEKSLFLHNTYRIPYDHIFSSRDALFKEKVIEATRGKGVNVVLNSLSGPLLQESWDCVAPFGRLVEIGKRDAQHNKRLSMKNFTNSTSYMAFDLVQMGRLRKELLYNSFSKVMSLVVQGKVKNQTPVLSFGLNEVQKAFRKLQSGDHIGKIVVRMIEGQQIQAIVKTNPIELDHEGSYLIVGGTSGIGLEIAVWMAQRGAKRLILLSRHAEQQDTDELHKRFVQHDTQLILRSCNVADQTTLNKVVCECHRERPIRGVIQAAVILQDSMFRNMTAEQWHGSVHPKTTGTENLDRAFQNIDLRFFIILSSTTSILGNPGQANYTAAGTYQDAFARRRVQNGLPGVSISIGSVPTVGVAARAGVADRLDRAGYRSQSVPEILHLVELAIRNPRQGQIVTGIQSWSNPKDLQWRHEPRFGNLWLASGEQEHGSEQEQQDSLKERLLGMSKGCAIKELIQVLKARLADIFNLPSSDIDEDLSLNNFGVDSLVAGELRNWLALQITQRISIFDIAQSNSLRDLAGKIMDILSAD